MFFILIFQNCDSKQDRLSDFKLQVDCYSFNICNETRGTRFGIIGDSWTDLAGGQPFIKTLRVYLEEDYGYHFTGATIGGQKIQNVFETGVHYQVIDNAGPNLKYMLISLGGNDFMFMNTFNYFLPDIQTEINNRIAVVEERILALVQSGNSYKRNRWGGEPLVWIFHGYDYGNPDSPTLPNTILCRPDMRASGFTDVQTDNFPRMFLDSYYKMLYHAASLETSIRIIDLRGSLGGPPVSNVDLMFDCIHPNTKGFGIISANYVEQLKFWSGNEK